MSNNTIVHTSLLVSVTTWNWQFSYSLSSICDMCWTVLKRWHPHWTETLLLRWHLLIEQTNCTTLRLPALSPYNFLPNQSPTCGRIHSAFMKTEKSSCIGKDTLWKQRASTSNQTTAESPTFLGFLRGLQSQVFLRILVVCPHPPWPYNVSTTLNYEMMSSYVQALSQAESPLNSGYNYLRKQLHKKCSVYPESSLTLCGYLTS